MKVTIIIPARFKSTRFPGKPLTKLNCGGGIKKSLINLTWDAAKKVNSVDDVFVATDDKKISDAVKAFGGKVIMTSENCKNGTERCAEAVKKISPRPELVINFQGDAPLTPPWFVEDLIKEMSRDCIADMATPVLRLDRTAYEKFLADRKSGSVGGTTVATNSEGYALYFSKEVIPYIGADVIHSWQEIPVFHHVGVYAYRPKSLDKYVNWQEGRLEKFEGLEQLRFLENGGSVKCVEVNSYGELFWELNNPEDIDRIEKIFKKKTVK